MAFQGIHFDEALMTLGWFDAKQEGRSLSQEECQCGSEEREGQDEAKAKGASKEEGYEKDFNRFKMREEVSMMRSESIFVEIDAR